MSETLLVGVEFLDPNRWQEVLGPALLWVSLVVIFIECGLLFPFLPGDTLLFGLGLFIATGTVDVFPGSEGLELVLATSLLVTAAFAGNVVGYEIGRRIGPPIYGRDGRILKRRYFDQTRDFFDRHGPIALVAGRFVAFVRTFVTVVAGATRMPRQRFFLWSAVGALLWVVSVMLLGYYLGRRFPTLGERIDIAFALIMAVFAIPLVWEWRHNRRQRQRQGGRGGSGNALGDPCKAAPPEAPGAH